MKEMYKSILNKKQTEKGADGKDELVRGKGL